MQGWDERIGIDFSGALPDAAQIDLGVSLDRRKRQGSYVMGRMSLRSTVAPHCPGNLVWLPAEPLWQEIVRARLESGLRDFSLTVAYADDYGIDVQFKAMVEQIGLRTGGAFTQHERTIWQLQGSFTSWP
jgi:hypothetical protein